MKYYVVSTTEDDGWEFENIVVGVKKTWLDAVNLMIEKENEFQKKYDYMLKDCEVERTDNYVRYEDNGSGWWYRIKYEIVEEVE